MTYCECKHGETSHSGWLRECYYCPCRAFAKAADQTPPPEVPDVDPQTVVMERIATALESIDRDLAMMTRR